MKQCPYCLRQVDDGARTCPCGYWFPIAGRKQTSSRAIRKGPIWTLDQDAESGTAATRTQTENPTPPQVKLIERTIIWVGIVYAVVALLLSVDGNYSLRSASEIGTMLALPAVLFLALLFASLEKPTQLPKDVSPIEFASKLTWLAVVFGSATQYGNGILQILGVGLTVSFALPRLGRALSQVARRIDQHNSRGPY